jgi:hypothetical protein
VFVKPLDNVLFSLCRPLVQRKAVSAGDTSREVAEVDSRQFDFPMPPEVAQEHFDFVLRAALRGGGVALHVEPRDDLIKSLSRNFCKGRIDLAEAEDLRNRVGRRLSPSRHRLGTFLCEVARDRIF